MNIQRASEQFDQWDSPWSFIDEIRSSLSDSPEDLALVDSIWTDARHQDHWLIATPLVQCSEAVFAALHMKYPSVNEHTLKNFIKAASYHWK